MNKAKHNKPSKKSKASRYSIGSRKSEIGNAKPAVGNQTRPDHRELLKKVRRIQIRTRHMVNDVFAGQYHSVFKGRGMEFDEVREYVPGDDIRSIDWNVTARTGMPHIKKFVEEREMTVMLLVDVSASQHFGSLSQLKNDLASELAAVLAFSAIRNNDRVGLLLFSDQIEKYVPPKKGSAHVLRLIREILYHRPENKTTDVRPALEFLNRVCTRRAVTFLISDFMFEDNWRKLMSITARHHDLSALIIGDPHEQAWPSAGIVEWEDAETGKRILADTSSPAVRSALALRHAEQRETLLSNLRRSRIDAVELTAGADYERELIRFFNRRATRR